MGSVVPVESSEPSAAPEAGAYGALLADLVRAAASSGASDLHIRAGSAPLLRIRGELWPMDMAPLTAEQSLALVEACLVRDRDRRAFDDVQECDFALDIAGAGRFRGNAYRERGSASVVLRHVAAQVPTLDDLHLPQSIARLALAESGLLLVAGPTGSGKSTTLASLVGVITSQRRSHILTIEDPIEFLHADGLSTVSQREVGTDTPSFAQALRAGMRQDPDVICVGEIRDLDTLRTALQAAETGHLVMASVHARTAADAINRVCDLFPADEQRQARTTLAEVLKGVVCQRLVPSRDGTSRLPVLEILVSTPRVVDAIVDPDSGTALYDVIAEGSHYGMRTFQDDLVRLVMEGSISVEVAERTAPRPADLHVALKRAGYVAAREARGA